MWQIWKRLREGQQGWAKLRLTSTSGKTRLGIFRLEKRLIRGGMTDGYENKSGMERVDCSWWPTVGGGVSWILLEACSEQTKGGGFTCCVVTPGSSLLWDVEVGVECFHQPKGRLGKLMKNKFIEGLLNTQTVDSSQGVPKLWIVGAWEGAWELLFHNR